MLTKTQKAQQSTPPIEIEAPSKPIHFVGYMAGARKGFTTSQGWVLANLLRGHGWRIATVSKRHTAWLRAADIAQSLLRLPGDTGAVLIEVYSGRNFLLADIASLLASVRGIPTVMVLHGGSLPSAFRTHPGWTRRVLARAALLAAPSPYLARSVREAHGLEAVVIPNVAPVDRYRHRRRGTVRPRLFWMRGFHEIYDPRMAIRVLARLAETHADAHLVMAGRADADREAVRRYAAECGLAGRVSFPGFLDLDGKNRFAGECDVFINTSRVDNMPVAVVEALALGLPVVATEVGGIADFLCHGENALLVAGGDDRAMANAIERLIADPDLVERLTRSGRELAMESSPERVIPRWADVFRRVGAA